MVQTGVPFGEVAGVRDWLQIQAEVSRPAREHPRRPITGFLCARSEISGRRLWGLFAGRFGTPSAFFQDHLVLNYCPLAFIEESGKNRTPDKLGRKEKARLFAICDAHLRAAVDAVKPAWLVGIGGFAAERAWSLFGDQGPKIGQILHPSPANPSANRDWSATVTRQLEALGVWEPIPGPKRIRNAVASLGRTRLP
jgi:single-strand selective monofunctional uracil DNA glycosylase